MFPVGCRTAQEIVHMLLEAGADKDLADNRGSTALMLAAKHGQMGILVAEPVPFPFFGGFLQSL